MLLWFSEPSAGAGVTRRARKSLNSGRDTFRSAALSGSGVNEKATGNVEELGLKFQFLARSCTSEGAMRWEYVACVGWMSAEGSGARRARALAAALGGAAAVDLGGMSCTVFDETGTGRGIGAYSLRWTCLSALCRFPRRVSVAGYSSSSACNSVCAIM